MAKLTVPFNGGSGGKKEPLKNQVYDINESEQPITLGEEIADLKNWYYDTEQNVDKTLGEKIEDLKNWHYDTEQSVDKTLGEKIGDLKNWYYDTEQKTVDGATKPVFDTVNLIANSQAIRNSGLLEGEWDRYLLYGENNKLGVTWSRTYPGGVVTIRWEFVNMDESLVEGYVNTYTPPATVIWDGNGEPPQAAEATSVWQKYTVTQEMVDNNIEPTKTTITSQDELPDIVIDPSCIAPNYENVFPEFYETLKETQDVDLTLGEKVADLKNWTYDTITQSSELEDKVYNVKMQDITGIDFSSKKSDDLIAASQDMTQLVFFNNNNNILCINYYNGKENFDFYYNPLTNRWEDSAGNAYVGEQLTFDLVVESIRDEDSLKKILEMPGGTSIQVSLKEKFDSIDEAIENVTNNMESGYLKDRAYEKVEIEHGRTYKPKLNMNITQETLDTIFSGFSSGDEIYRDYTKGSWIIFYSDEYTISLNYKPDDNTDSIYYTIADSRYGWRFVNMWRIGGIAITSQNQLPSMLFHENAIANNPNSMKVIQLMFEEEPTLGDKIDNIKDLTYFRTAKEIVPMRVYTLPKKYDLSQFKLPEDSSEIIFDNDNDLSIKLYSDCIEVIQNGYSKYNNGNHWIDENDDEVSEPEIRFTDEELQSTEYVRNLDALEKVLGIIKVTFRQKFATCLTLERLEDIGIVADDIETNYDYSEYSDAGYNYLATIQNDAFKNALKVEVLFSIAQVDAGNICSIQEIDTEYGVLTLFLKDNSSDITLNRIDIFKYNTDTSIDNDDSDSPTPSPDPIAGGQLI